VSVLNCVYTRLILPEKKYSFEKEVWTKTFKPKEDVKYIRNSVIAMTKVITNK
jgi:hypothetical protein